jgi:uncharacterized protein (TIGR00730 family)
MSEPNPCTREEWPLKAYKNLTFLNSESARPLRILSEIIEPGPRFKAAGVKDTIVLFGSARLLPVKEAQAEHKKITEELAGNNAPTGKQKRAMNKARAMLKAAPYYDAAQALSKSLATWSQELPGEAQNRYTICSGGGPGIMEAANRGAADASAPSVGLGISLPHEQSVNKYIPEDLSFEFHYFFVRKYWFVSMAKALVAFPGGFGTLDELFETLTLIQTGKTNGSPPIVLYGREFWESVINFEALVEWGTISPEDLDLFCIVDTVEEAHAFITQALTKQSSNDES